MNNYNVNNNKATISKFSLILFFIHPFFAFVIALGNLKYKNSRLVLLFFFTLFGYTFLAENESADSFWYIQEFNSYVNSTTSEFVNEFNEYKTFETTQKDLYVISTYFIVSRFTTNYHFLMALWAFVFSFFYLKAFNFLVIRPEFRKSIYVSLLVFLFMFTNNIFNINGVRFWTAAWISVYVFFEVLINKNRRYILLALLTPLIHVSFFVIPLILILSIISKKHEKLMIYLFLISFLVGELSVDLVQTYKNTLPQTFQNLIWSYTESDSIEKRMEDITNAPLYSRILQILPRLLLNVFMVILILNRSHFEKNKDAYSMFLFLLLWLGFCNFTMAIPSFGSRFIVLGFPLIAYLILLTYSDIKILKKSILIIPLAFSYVTFLWIRQMISVTDPYLILSFFPHIVIKNLFL